MWSRTDLCHGSYGGKAAHTQDDSCHECEDARHWHDWSSEAHSIDGARRATTSVARWRQPMMVTKNDPPRVGLSVNEVSICTFSVVHSRGSVIAALVRQCACFSFLCGFWLVRRCRDRACCCEGIPETIGGCLMWRALTYDVTEPPRQNVGATDALARAGAHACALAQSLV